MQLKGAFAKNYNKASDREKAYTDFIQYSELNLTWFAYNFVVCFMPLACMFLQNSDLEYANATASYKPIIITLIVANLLKFVGKLNIYKLKEEE